MTKESVVRSIPEPESRTRMTGLVGLDYCALLFHFFKASRQDALTTLLLFAVSVCLYAGITAAVTASTELFRTIYDNREDVDRPNH